MRFFQITLLAREPIDVMSHRHPWVCARCLANCALFLSLSPSLSPSQASVAIACIVSSSLLFLSLVSSMQQHSDLLPYSSHYISDEKRPSPSSSSISSPSFPVTKAFHRLPVARYIFNGSSLSLIVSHLISIIPRSASRISRSATKSLGQPHDRCR
ncbi:hypothetical protein ACLOJK_014304 [Asimina triloba]